MIKLITIQKCEERTGKVETFISHGIDSRTGCNVDVAQDRIEDSGAQYDAKYGWHFPDVVVFAKVKDSKLVAHQTVTIDDVLTGHVWREQKHVNVSKFTAPRRTALKWRWFAKQTDSTTTLGKGTRVAMILGEGYSSREKAVDALIAATQDKTES